MDFRAFAILGSKYVVEEAPERPILSLNGLKDDFDFLSVCLRGFPL
jgi:hypothetical protein